MISKLTFAPNSTKLARFWTDLATSVRVRPAAEDGGSGGRDRRQTLDKVPWRLRVLGVFFFLFILLTSYDVEHSGVEDGRTDES